MNTKQKDTHFMEIAFHIASASKCLRAKYGAVIVSKDGRIVSTGRNGKPRGSTNDDVCYREGLKDNARGFVIIHNSETPYKLIELSQDTYCFVDEDDFEWINQWKWYLSSTGYAVRNTTKTEKETIKRTVIKLHREIALKNGILQDQNLSVDHISGYTLDNRLINLRTCSHQENTMNSKNRKNNTSGFKGVGKLDNGRWRSYIKKDGKYISLGVFDNSNDANNAYLLASNELFGEFVRKSDVEYKTLPNCCIHSEANAIMFSTPEERDGATMYVSGIPCTDCALLIAQSGIDRLVYFVGEQSSGHKGNFDVEFYNKYGMKFELVPFNFDGD